MREPRTVAVVGAGPAGVATAIEFHRAGWRVVCFERSDRLGGVFSRGWQGLRFVSSSAISDFSTFDHPRFSRSTPVFYTADEYVEYLHAYLDFAGLPPASFIRFGHTVTAVRLDDADRIEVRAQGAPDDSLVVERVDHLAICTGLHSGPSERPTIPGLDGFTGRVMRSTDFATPAVVRGERVIVVGGGESASDIADLIADETAELYVSSRRGPGVVIPRYDRFGEVVDVYTSRALYAARYQPPIRELSLRGSLRIGGFIDRKRPTSTDPIDIAARTWAGRINSEPNMQRSPYTRFGTKTLGLGRAIARGAIEKPAIEAFDVDQVRFVDGSAVECDVVIFAVGFSAPRFSAIDGLPDFDLAALYKRMIPTASPWSGRLSLIGFARPGVGAIPPLAELQARLAVEVAIGRHRLPPPGEMRADVERVNALLAEQYPLDVPQRSALVDFVGYMLDLARTLGCEPDLGRLLRTDPRLWAQVVFGPLHAAQFRLSGPSAERSAARARLLALPRRHPLVAGGFLGTTLLGKALHAVGLVERGTSGL